MERFFLLIVLIINLSACSLGMSVATTGAQTVYNRHGFQRKITDQYITLRSYRKIYRDTDRYAKCNISVAVFNNDVLLTGEIKKEEFRSELTNLIKSIPEVGTVYNMLAVAPASSALTVMSDSWLTTKIKTKLTATLDLDPSQIKVVSEDGTVFLMGVLFPEDASHAVEIARQTFGVQRVVKLFKYIHITDNIETDKTKEQTLL